MQDTREKDVENVGAESFVDLGRPKDGSSSFDDELPPVSGSGAVASDSTGRVSGYRHSSSASAQESTSRNVTLHSRGQSERLSSNMSTTSLHNNNDDVVPSQIGRQTCPICIVDFAEGDDIRVLPCDGKHCFHQQCVDPWLLKLSSSCPICRHGRTFVSNFFFPTCL